jgi:SAM-dependent methyltransferase
MIPQGQQTHKSDPRVLNRRTLQADHRVLASLLQPGQSVLDAGCGAGSITRGIAGAVGPTGYVLGIDRDTTLLEHARATASPPHLHFAEADPTNLTLDRTFDVATAARVLQWIGKPELALRSLHRALKPHGLLVVLDYNHAGNRWRPLAPPEFQRFYNAFLAWRAAHGWDNHMAANLPKLLQNTGFGGIQVHDQDEISNRDDPDFPTRAAIWPEVAESLGPKLVDEAFLSAAQLDAARAAYDAWRNTTLEVQVLNLKAVTAHAESTQLLSSQ